jgi:hypothetical protein
LYDQRQEAGKLAERGKILKKSSSDIDNHKQQRPNPYESAVTRFDGDQHLTDSISTNPFVSGSMTLLDWPSLREDST